MDVSRDQKFAQIQQMAINREADPPITRCNMAMDSATVNGKQKVSSIAFYFELYLLLV